MASSLGKLRLNIGETPLFDGPGSYAYDPSTLEHGRVLITNQRLLFCVHSKLAPSILVNLFKLKATNLFVEVPLASVQAIEQEAHPRIKMATLHKISTAGDYTFSFLLHNKYNVRFVTSFQSGMEAVNPAVQCHTRESRIDFA